MYFSKLYPLQWGYKTYFKAYISVYDTDWGMSTLFYNVVIFTRDGQHSSSLTFSKVNLLYYQLSVLFDREDSEMDMGSNLNVSSIFFIEAYSLQSVLETADMFRSTSSVTQVRIFFLPYSVTSHLQRAREGYYKFIR